VSIKTRLQRLEGGDGGACAVCGYTPGDLIRFDIRSDEQHSPFYRPEPPPEPEHCIGCGRVLTFTINVEYAGDFTDLEDT
jgi:hypothetical protein